MQDGVQMPNDIRKLAPDNSRKLQWLREQAAGVRLDRESGKITDDTAKQRLNALLSDRRGFLARLLGQ